MKRILTMAALAAAGCGAERSPEPERTSAGHTSAARTPVPTRSAGQARALAGETERGGSGGYRIVGAPLLFRGPPRDVTVIVRLNRALPKPEFDSGGDANFLIGYAGLDATPERYGRLSRHCYLGVIRPTATDARVLLTVHVHGYADRIAVPAVVGRSMPTARVLALCGGATGHDD